MVDYLVAMVIVAFGMMAIGISALFIMPCVTKRRKNRSTQSAYVALASPSVRTARNAFDRRVALAVHEAKQGSQVCSACEFTNVLHASACVRCSSRLRHQEEAPTKRRGLFTKRRGHESVFPALLPVMEETDLHRRIRRRREWTRRLNDAGELEWHHNEKLCEQATVGLSSYVLQATSTLSTTQQEEASRQQPIGHDFHEVVSIEIIDDEHAQEEGDAVNTIVDVSTELNERVRDQTVTLVDATEGDASCIAFAATNSNSARTLITVDVATSSQLPFPTKLAHFITSVAGLVSSAGCDSANAEFPSFFRLSIRRKGLLADSIAALATLSPTSVRAAIRVDIEEDEQGIDAGGVYREWFLLMNEAIVMPEAGIFTCVDHQNQTFYLNPHSREILGDDHLAHFLAAGRLLGRALLDGNVTGFHLAMPLLKIILGQPVGFGDLKYFDSEVYKHLKWLLAHVDVDALCLDFTVTEKLPGGTTRTVELVPRGAHIEVTDMNKVEFVDAKLKYLLFESVSEQLFAFLTGVYEVVPAELLATFDAEELDCVVSGSDQIDVDDWEANSIAPKSLLLQSSLRYFWRAVRELSLEERQRLLQFATGSSRVPPGGFRALTSNDGKLCLFNFRGMPPSLTRGYLHSHACFNRLDLPLHGSTELMRQAIQAAISSDSTGFTTA